MGLAEIASRPEKGSFLKSNQRLSALDGEGLGAIYGGQRPVLEGLSRHPL